MAEQYYEKGKRYFLDDKETSIPRKLQSFVKCELNTHDSICRVCKGKMMFEFEKAPLCGWINIEGTEDYKPKFERENNATIQRKGKRTSR